MQGIFWETCRSTGVRSTVTEGLWPLAEGSCSPEQAQGPTPGDTRAGGVKRVANAEWHFSGTCPTAAALQAPALPHLLLRWKQAIRAARFRV